MRRKHNWMLQYLNDLFEIKLIILQYDRRILQLSEFVWTLLNKSFLSIFMISIHQKRSFLAVSGPIPPFIFREHSLNELFSQDFVCIS